MRDATTGMFRSQYSGIPSRLRFVTLRYFYSFHPDLGLGPWARPQVRTPIDAGLTSRYGLEALIGSRETALCTDT